MGKIGLVFSYKNNKSELLQKFKASNIYWFLFLIRFVNLTQARKVRVQIRVGQLIPSYCIEIGTGELSIQTNEQKLGAGNSESKFPGPCIIYSFGVDHSTLVNIAQLHNYNL